MISGGKCNLWARIDIIKALTWECTSIPKIVNSVLHDFSVQISLHPYSLGGSLNVRIPSYGYCFDELCLVSFKHCGGLSILIKSHLHNVLDLIWVDSEVEVHWDFWQGVL